MQGLARLSSGAHVLQNRLGAVISAQLGPSSSTWLRQQHTGAAPVAGGSTEEAQPSAPPSSSTATAAAAGDSGSRWSSSSSPREGGHGPASDEEQPKQQRQRRERRQRGGEGQQSQSGFFPAALSNVSRAVTRQDIVDFFKDYNLTADEVRVQYTRALTVDRFWCNFPSQRDRDRALERKASYLGSRRAVVRAGTPEEFKAEIYNPLAMSSRGRYVVVNGLAESSTSEDVLRFFHGFDMHVKGVTFVREHKGLKSTLGRAVVRFETAEEANRAVRTKQGGYCLNVPITLKQLV